MNELYSESAVVQENLLPFIMQYDSSEGQDGFEVWYGQHKEEIASEMLKSGGVLIQGLGIQDLEQFEKLVDVLTKNTLTYVDGNSPRSKLSSKVYTSTEYDKNFHITMHNELSYSHQWPSKIYFSCVKAASKGGETPIADGRKVLEVMNPELVEMIKTKKIKYYRNLHGGGGIGPSWQETFETEDKEEVAKFCQGTKSELEWKADGGLRIIQHHDGIITHPVTGEEVWFNQIDQFHPSHLDTEIYETLMMMYGDDPKELPMYVSFGDDAEITEAMVAEITRSIEEVNTYRSWNEGELLLLDNVLTMHGRAPYEGERRVLVSMS